MGSISRFEDVEAWKMARQLTREIYSMTSTGLFSRDYGLRDQLRRASVSIMSNIAEGFERGGSKEFRQFLAVAKGSAGEIRSQLYIAPDAGYIDPTSFDHLSRLTMDISRCLAGFIRYLASSELKGNKLRESAIVYQVPSSSDGPQVTGTTGTVQQPTNKKPEASNSTL